jgi:hypothetical protein
MPVSSSDKDISGKMNYSIVYFYYIILIFGYLCSVGKQVVNVPSFVVRVDSEKHIDLAVNSPYGQGRPGRVARRRAAQRAAAGGAQEDEDV